MLCDKLALVPDWLASLNPAHTMAAAVIQGPVRAGNEGPTG